jgi:hypothetical protein
MQFTRGCPTLAHFKKRINRAREIGINRVPIINKGNYAVYERVIEFTNKNKNSKLVSLKIDMNSFMCYSNDLKILKELLVLSKNIEITEVVTPLPEIMYFGREPKYPFRVYIKAIKVPESLIDTLTSFRNTHEPKETVKFSESFSDFLDYQPSRVWRWDRYLRSGFFINYKDESMLTYMHLMFNECMGKNYKLEKRPE